MNPDYRTVFVVTEKGFDWWFPAFGLIFLAIGVALVIFGRRRLWPVRRSWVAYFMVAFSILWTSVAFVSSFSQYHDAQKAYREGRYAVVEGTVEHFQPMPYEGHSEECFSVKDDRFCYSDYTITAGFNQTASHGGPIREGLPIRIAYNNALILRIDIPADKIPPTSDRQSRQIIAQQEYTERSARDPNLDKMTLGFGFAVVLWTLWWNIDYLRFMKFWLKPLYKQSTVVIFRVLFALWFLGAARWFFENLIRTTRPARVYAEALGVGIAWSLAILLMVNLVEWMNRKRQA